MTTKSKYLLPEELGLECNEAVGRAIDEWVVRFQDNRVDMIATNAEYSKMFWIVAKSELADNIYTIIKKYQHETH